MCAPDPQSPTTAPLPIDPRYQDPEDEEDPGLGEENAESTSSLESSILDYRSIHGRTFGNSKTTEYWAPNDEQQNEGLDLTHHYVTLLLDDKLFLAPIGDHPQKVLDIGTGTGIWAMDFADEFPSSQVIGTDISPIQPQWVPPNCQFQIDDAQLDWTWPGDHFDFIHIRNMHGSISDWPALYARALEHIRPGGWLESVEFDIRTHSDNVPKDHIFHRWNDVFQEAGERMGRTFKIGTEGRMKRLITEAGFTNVVEKRWVVPIGGWSSDPKFKNIGLYTLLFLEQSLEGFALYMLSEVMHWKYEEIQVLVAQMRRGLRDRKTLPYFYITLVYAQKPRS